MVAQPMITMAQHQGPWPTCLGISGDDCVSYIESNAEDVRGNVYVISHGTSMTMDFRKDRVRVFVDDDGIVDETPSRG
jgi:hypothetical protein